MNFGLFLMPFHPPRRSLADSYDRDIEIIVQADRLGYREVWIGEHITESWENVPVPELLIAKALGVTENIVLGTGVTILPLHNPVETAHRIAMLDQLARGRFYWGIGERTILPTDLKLYGVEDIQEEAVRARGKEALEVILGLWAAEDGQYQHEGKYFNIQAPYSAPPDGRRDLQRKLYYRPYQQPHPPIAVAAATPKTRSLRLAGERGWIPMSGYNLFAEQLREQWQQVEHGAASAGRKADRSQWRIGRDVYVGETPESARDEARMVLGGPYNEYWLPNRRAFGSLSFFKLDPAMPDEAVDADYMMETSWIVGDPQEVADKIRRLYEDVGGFGTLLAVGQDPDDHSLAQRSQRLLIEEVAPRLRDLE